MHEDDDILRARLARLDPVAGQQVPPISDKDRERAMSTSTEDRTDTPPAPRRRTPRLLAAAAGLAVVAAGVTAVVVINDDGTTDPEPIAEGDVLELTAEPANVAASCIRPDAALLQTAEVAFAGTVVEVNGTGALLDVERWYKGGDEATQVSLTQDGGPDAGALTGITFQQGMTYLVNATDGVVGMCSGSGTDSPQLRALFDEAYGG